MNLKVQRIRTFKQQSGKFLLKVLLLFGFINTGICQAKPDFSGEWNLNPEKSKLQAFWTDGLTYGNIRITHNEPVFNLRRSFTIKRKEKLLNYTLETNETGKKGEHKTTWSLSWKQDTLELVIVRKSMVNAVKYYMSELKDEFVAEEHFNSPKMNYINLWVFDSKTEE